MQVILRQTGVMCRDTLQVTIWSACSKLNGMIWESGRKVSWGLLLYEIAVHLIFHLFSRWLFHAHINVNEQRKGVRHCPALYLSSKAANQVLCDWLGLGIECTDQYWQSCWN